MNCGASPRAPRTFSEKSSTKNSFKNRAMRGFLIKVNQFDLRTVGVKCVRDNA